MAFFDSLFGKSQKRDLEAANQGAQAALGQSRTAQRGDITGGRDAAIGTLDPYMQGGRRGQTAYENTLGLNGAAARQQQFQTGYLDDPALAYRDQQTGTQINNLLRKYNAGPQGVNSGAAALGVGRLRSENFDRDWGDYRNRLMQQGQQGYGAANTAAGFQYGAGQQLAGVEGNYGQQMASNAINYGNAMAASRNIGLNNLLNIAGTAAKFIPGTK